MKVSALAWRSLVCRRRQYFPLFLVCTVCAGFSFFVFFLSSGMTEAFRNKARVYYGGDLQFIGGRTGLEFPDVEKTIETLRPVFSSDTVITSRLDLDARTYSLYYEGTEVVLRVIKGVDFKAEESLFNSFTFVPPSGTGDFASPSVPSLQGTNSILLSNQIADRLGVQQGDTFTFFCRTIQGYMNSVEFRVGGVFLDSSILGLYTAYCDIDFLRKTFGFSPEYSNRISFIFREPLSEKDLRNYQEKLSDYFSMYPLVTDKQVFYRDLIHERLFENHPTYALISLEANQEDVLELTNAMDALFFLVVVMLSLIIIAGMGSTYRVIILKRVNEIGIYMSIGMRNIRISSVFFLEAMFLLLSGCVCGLAFSGILCVVSRSFNLSAIPGIDIFLEQGFLSPSPAFVSVILFSLMIFVTTGLSVLFTIRKTMTISPVEAIRITE